MLITETAPKRSEHIEWLNALDFYKSYLKIIRDRMNALDTLDYSNQVETKRNSFADKLELLIIRLNELAIEVSEHVEEMEFEPIFENKLDMVVESMHHDSLHEKFENFENDLNAFRTDFNEFYVRWI